MTYGAAVEVDAQGRELIGGDYFLKPHQWTVIQFPGKFPRCHGTG
jgi:hypothetical protein